MIERALECPWSLDLPQGLCHHHLRELQRPCSTGHLIHSPSSMLVASCTCTLLQPALSVATCCIGCNMLYWLSLAHLSCSTLPALVTRIRSFPCRAGARAGRGRGQGAGGSGRGELATRYSHWAAQSRYSHAGRETRDGSARAGLGARGYMKCKEVPLFRYPDPIRCWRMAAYAMGWAGGPLIGGAMYHFFHERAGGSPKDSRVRGRARARACVRACVCACVRACVRARMRACADASDPSNRSVVAYPCLLCARVCATCGHLKQYNVDVQRYALATRNHALATCRAAAGFRRLREHCRLHERGVCAGARARRCASRNDRAAAAALYALCAGACRGRVPRLSAVRTASNCEGPTVRCSTSSL